VSTHSLTFTRDRVVKRYRSWDRGEPDREWTGLGILHQHAPGISPQPLRRGCADGVPLIEMTRVPGVPLGGEKLSPAQTGALAQALRQMYWAVPREVLTPLPGRQWVGRQPPGELAALVRSWVRDTPPVACAAASDALQATAAWLDSADLSNLSGPLAERVFTHGDGNLGNFLWDGTGCHIVDFEDAGISDPAYEAADLLEHVSVRLAELIEADDLIEALGLTPAQQARLSGFRRLMAVYWLLMLLPGNPAHDRNPPGSLERQAAHVAQML
jgi:aminoglycoside phosphotransferase (APT) family kinase protein